LFSKQAILNYLRTGKLHLPRNVCGPAAKSELQYWGVDERLIERCCWHNYNGWNSTLKALDRLERDLDGSQMSRDESRSPKNWKSRTWAILNNHNSSVMAKVYNTIQYNTIQYNAIQYNTVQYNTIQYHTIPYHTIQYNTIQYDTIQYNTIQYNTIQYNTILYKCNT
jgi:hypothetical protein